MIHALFEIVNAVARCNAGPERRAPRRPANSV